MVIKFYFDLMSQPSRALYILLKTSKIPFEACPVAIRKGEHLTEEFKQKYTKFQKIPFIHDGDFRLGESVAVARYLSREYPIDDHWYPKESRQQAKVDEYLEWQHLNTRHFCATYFRTKWLYPLVTGKQPTPETLQNLEKDMVNCLDRFVEYFLSSGPFVNGATKVSIADLLAACEIEQLRLADYEPRVGRPILETWIEKVRNECNPYYDEAHVLLHKLVDRSKKDQAKL